MKTFRMLFVIIIECVRVHSDGRIEALPHKRYYVDASCRRSAVAWYLQEHCNMNREEAYQTANLTAFVRTDRNDSSRIAMIPMWGQVMKVEVEVPDTYISRHFF